MDRILTIALIPFLIQGLIACDSGKDDTGPTDADGDGFPSSDDCDDDDPGVNPGADEACGGADEDCDGLVDEADATGCSPFYEEADGDGYGTDASACLCEPEGAFTADSDGDCDDADDEVYPGAAEACDGEDADCDGTTNDEDASGCEIYYADEDSDGYGGSSSTCLCEPEGTYTAEDDDDCDDDDPGVNPGADEVCGGADEDCDGLVDEADTTGCSPYYEDADGDGYGTDASACLCEPEGDFTADSDGDCDDGDASANPEAAETCGGGDEDCDGDTDEVGADGCEVYHEDRDGDGYGGSSSTCLCEPEGAYTAEDDDDCDDADASVNPGAVEVCEDGIDNDCDGGPGACALSGEIDLSVADAKLVGEDAGDYAGWSLASGDVDDDGVADVLVGAYDEDAGGTNAGAAYLVLGPTTGTVDLSTADAKLVGEAASDYAGYSLASGDVDGDGVADVLVGAYCENAGGLYAGAAYLVLGPATGTVDLSAADAKFVGEDVLDYAGYSLASGDVDGDDVADILVGALADDAGGTDGGAAYLVLGPATGTLDLSAADAKFVSEDGHDSAGYSLASGDVDGDGVADVLVGAPYEDAGGTDAGAAYLVLGPATGTVDLSAADAKLVGEAASDYAGMSLAPGDVDGDGNDDVLVGALAEDTGGTSAGAAYLVLGPASGTVDLSDADAKLVGEAVGDVAGRSLVSGDVDGDGVGDVLVGVANEDTGGSSAGAAYLVFGPATGTVDLSAADAKLVGEVAGDYAGWSLASGDVDGDGVGDVLVGADYQDAGGTDSGAAYLLYGGGL